MSDGTEGSQGLPEGEAVLEDPAVANALANMEAEREIPEAGTPGEGEGGEPPHAETSEEGADDPAGKKPKPDQTAIDKRIAELTRARYAEKRRAETLEAEKAALEERIKLIGKGEDGKGDPKGEPKPQTEDERQRDIRAEAQRLRDLDRFNEECNRTADNGAKEFEDFGAARDDIVTAFGATIQRRPDFLEAINELPEGHKVFYHLGKNLDEADRILKLPPVKMALELSKLAIAVGKPAGKPISKTPAPISPIGGGARNGATLDEKAPMEKWSQDFLKDAAKW